MRQMSVKASMATVALCLFASSALGQITTIECVYSKYSDGEELVAPKKRFALTFLIDKANGSAYMTGNNGSTKVNIVPSQSGLSFIEITKAGNVMTTVFDLHGASIHSRGTRIDGHLVPSQYYGTCTSK